MSGDRGEFRNARQRIASAEAQGAEMARQNELTRKIQIRQRERMMLESGPMLDHGANDGGCPACGAMSGWVIAAQQSAGWAPEKVHCGGRDPHPVEGSEASCVILGDHLHARCPACQFSWFERVKFDTAKLPNRGALRFDEVIVREPGVDDGDRKAISIPQPPTLESVWGYVEPGAK